MITFALLVLFLLSHWTPLHYGNATTANAGMVWTMTNAYGQPTSIGYETRGEPGWFTCHTDDDCEALPGALYEDGSGYLMLDDTRVTVCLAGWACDDRRSPKEYGWIQ